MIKYLPDQILHKFIFLISGDGPDKNIILDSIINNNNIIYLGLLTEEQLNTILFNIDVVCIPSIAAEGFCLPARQAMILNKFILHTGQGGLLETTNNYYKSLLFNYTDIESLKLQLINILDFKTKQSDNYVFDSYEFKLKKLFKYLHE